MFKKTRRKIVAVIMTILVLLWAGTLGVIYASSYIEMKKQNVRMMKTHAEMYNPSAFSGRIPPTPPKLNDQPLFEPGFDPESPMFQLSIFYTVALSHEGAVCEIKNEPPTLYTDENLTELALSILDSEKTTGTKENLAFYKEDKGDYILVVFMDNTVTNERAMTLFRYTLIFGGAALILFFVLSVYLAKRIVAPLEESYQKQKQFISDAGHELKTPISVIGANVELLLREIENNQWLSNIQYENERMGLLVTQLLDLARTENAVPQMEQIDFSRLVSGEILPFESIAFEKGLIFNSDIAADLWIEGNQTQLKQLVSILIDNAIRYSKEEGVVEASLKKDANAIRLSVRNQGDEIPAEQRKQIFERFYRIDTVRNSEDMHYGLGLAIAKAIVAAHKGQIEVLCYDGQIEFVIKLFL